MIFAKTKKVEDNFLDYKKEVVKTPTKKKVRIKQNETMLAFEFYYTIDWLYNETPFLYKLEVYV